MSNFRTTADLLDGVLRRCGEMTSDQGTSPLQPAALLYLNQIHNTIITGGNELEVDIDESWVWAESSHPLVLQLNAPYSGSVSISNGSHTLTFSTTPQDANGNNISLRGWYIRLSGGPEVYRIAAHTSGLNQGDLDMPFPQTTYSGAFTAFQLEYDLVPSVLTIDDYNRNLDLTTTGTAGTVSSTASLALGGYTPSELATEYGIDLSVADTNNIIFTGSYSTVSRLFTVTATQQGTASATFTLVGNGTSARTSGWNALGFDYLTQSGSMSYVSTYPLGAVARLTTPARIYYGNQYGTGASSGQVTCLDLRTFDRDYPLIDIKQGTPQCFAVTYEREGRMRVRFNKYPSQTMRVEFPHVPYPKDLQNNSASIPLLPRKWIRVLEYGASYYLMLDKSNDKAQAYLLLAQQLLKGMMKANRQDLEKSGKNFGAVIARPDLMPEKNYRRVNLYGYDSGDV